MGRNPRLSNLNMTLEKELNSSYERGWKDCKKAVLRILKQDIQNCDLSWENCDTRFIERVEKL